jgi:hypothetical protein
MERHRIAHSLSSRKKRGTDRKKRDREREKERRMEGYSIAHSLSSRKMGHCGMACLRPVSVMEMSSRVGTRVKPEPGRVALAEALAEALVWEPGRDCLRRVLLPGRELPSLGRGEVGG